LKNLNICGPGDVHIVLNPSCDGTPKPLQEKALRDV
jgi:hypothetical protein